MSDWQIVIQRLARRYLEKLTLANRERIINDLTILQTNPESLDFKPLKGRSDWRLRVGDYRVLVRVDRENKVFVVTRIGSRGDIYEK
ncbi:type II toxin-antitoxin system RelE/ParE family toxin [Chroococcus sp. FPU101]|uniref:type II toxin-antitoxin system RelE family toxin n=1 Tax=Chroococcus sp. FPU101 TaxID=1974212 RepID=UPI001A8EDBBD|nr:type II toxin-antitoxin system RelE/ParE family toxin [Chroococcus sp. FPU101]GFE70842.1 hypothetical protein CFPU101_34520 [Chroococcus sp. FPU101]